MAKARNSLFKPSGLQADLPRPSGSAHRSAAQQLHHPQPTAALRPSTHPFTERIPSASLAQEAPPPELTILLRDLGGAPRLVRATAAHRSSSLSPPEVESSHGHAPASVYNRGHVPGKSDAAAPAP